MNLSEFDFQVPEALVAQRPLADRDGARMMVISRQTGGIEHRKFRDLPDFVNAGDLMVFNKTKVLKARLFGHRSTGGKVEIFLLRRLSEARFEVLVKATASQKVGLEVEFSDGLKGRVLRDASVPMVFEFEFSGPAVSAGSGELDAWIEKNGHVPLPPYIHRSDEMADIGRYQTVYAEVTGSVAAPTAGLHFTEQMLAGLRAKGVEIDQVVLHVGLGTFQSIKVDSIEDHRMHRESFTVTPDLKAKIRATKAAGGRAIAVGTTSVRALESDARGIEGETELFLRPGEKFLAVDAMFTNFHQPKSSLVVMLAGFLGGMDLLKEAYSKAVEEKYRFFSYGDCMLVI